MKERRRHAVVLAVAASLLAGLFVTHPVWHGAFGVLAFVAARLVDPVVAKRIGAPRRWLVTALGLALAGLWLGPPDARFAGQAVSTAGALSAATMIARAVGMVLLGSAAGALYPAERALGFLRRTRLRRFAEVLVVAVELVPSLLSALATARREVGARQPGFLRAPRRAFETFVFAVEHASALADSVARRLGELERNGS